jgi:uncharacterized protein (DUF58 family)
VGEHERSPWLGFLSGAAVVAALLGFASGSAALIGFGAGWAAILALSFVLARRGLGHLQVERSLPSNAFEGDLLTVDVRLENHGQRPARFVLVQDVFGAGLADRQAVLEPGPLPGEHRRVLSYRAFVARQWGLYTVGPLSVGRFDPLGLFFARREVPRLSPFEVYPRSEFIEALATPGGRASLASRDVTAAAAGHSLVYRGVREYRAGDDVRRIHWPATARRGTPMVRENERDLQPVFLVFLDLDKRGRAGIGRKSTLEYLVRVGASLLWTAHRRGDALGLVAEADGAVVVPPAQGEDHLAAALHQLVVAKQTGSRALLDLVERDHELTPPGASVVILSATTDMDGEALERALLELRARAAEPVVIAIDAPAFTPVDRPPVPADRVRELRRALGERLTSLDVPWAILGPDDTPEEVVVRPDFLVRARSGAPVA